MTKNEFLLTLAIEFFNDGSDDAFHEIVTSKYFDPVEKFYGVKRPNTEAAEPGSMIEYHLWDEWGDTLSTIQNDVKDLLRSLYDQEKDKFPSTYSSVYPEKILEKNDLFALVVSPDNPVLSESPIASTWVFSLTSTEINEARIETLKLIEECEPNAISARILRCTEVDNIDVADNDKKE